MHKQSHLNKFIIAAINRPELDLMKCIEGCELGIIPRSLFASDGTLLLPYDKAKVLHQLKVNGSEGTGESISVLFEIRVRQPTILPL